MDVPTTNAGLRRHRLRFSIILIGGLLIASPARDVVGNVIATARSCDVPEDRAGQRNSVGLAAARGASPKGDPPRVIDDSDRNKHTGHNENSKRHGNRGHRGKRGP
jgi:hypothetical protein